MTSELVGSFSGTLKTYRNQFDSDASHFGLLTAKLNFSLLMKAIYEVRYIAVSLWVMGDLAFNQIFASSNLVGDTFDYIKLYRNLLWQHLLE